MEVVLLEDNNNILLKRREIKTIIKNAIGSIPREEATNLIAGKMGINKKNLLPISLKSEFGNPDVFSFDVLLRGYRRSKKTVTSLSNPRTMTKDERKKIIDEEKSVKLKAKQAAAAAAKSKKK